MKNKKQKRQLPQISVGVFIWSNKCELLYGLVSKFENRLVDSQVPQSEQNFNIS